MVGCFGALGGFKGKFAEMAYNVICEKECYYYSERKISWTFLTKIEGHHRLVCNSLEYLLSWRQLLGIFSLSGNTSYRKILCLVSRDLGADFSNCSEIWQAPQQQCCWDACQFWDWHNDYNIQSRGFGTSWDLAVRRLTTWWIEPLMQLCYDAVVTMLSSLVQNQIW